MTRTLRLVVPAVVFLIGLLFLAFFLPYEIASGRTRNREMARENLDVLGAVLATEIESAFRSERPDQARDLVSHLSNAPDFRLALLLEGTTVRFASRYDLEGKPLAETPLAPWSDRLTGSRDPRDRIHRIRDDGALLGRFHLLLGAEPGRIIPRRHGALVLEYDLTRLNRRVLEDSLGATLLVGTALALLCFLLWFFLDRRVVRRVARVERAATSLGLGDLTARAGVRGRDEIARLARAVDEMGERIQADATRLRRGREWFRQLIQNSADVTAVVDRDSRCSFVSPSIHAVLGREAAALVGRRLVDLVHPDDRSALLAALDGAATDEILELRLEHTGGTWRRIEARITDARDNDAIRGVVINARDVTERHDLEERLERTRRMEDLGRMAGGVAHDFNNLLTVILGMVELLERKERFDEGARAKLAEIRRAAEKGAGFTQQLLAFGRKEDIERRPIDPVRVIGELRRILHHLCPEGTELVLDLGPGVPVVLFDPRQLEQVLLNLIDNAAEAMPEGGRIVLSVRTVEDGSSRRVVLAVTDEGCGMEDATREKLFEPFYTTKEHGTGLGMAVVYGAVQHAGGDLRVRSAPGKGTTVEILLPVAEGVEELPPPVAEPAAAQPGQVLLVDNEHGILDFMTRLLSREGWQVRACRDGIEALEVLRAPGTTVDLLVTDVMMPRLSGPELIRAARELHPDLPAVLISGHVGGLEGEPDLLTLGAELLHKPFEGRRLLAAMNRALAARAQ